jgi:hypothetical protein
MLLTPPHRRRQDPALLPSITVQSIISECDSDVLLLYDCCHAIPTTTGIAGRGVKEFLAACGFESIAPEIGQDSFTHALIQELGKASYSSISVGELHGRLIDRLRTWKPCISKDEFGQMKLNSDGKPLYEKSKRKTPIHCTLSDEPKRRSIVLSPLPVAFGAPEQHFLSRPSSSDQPRKKKRYIYQSESDNGSEDTEDSTECTQVILSIRVDTEQFDLGAWLEWIKDIPPEATKVKVEGVYGSLSTLLLLRMPIAIWDLLPDDPAYSFVGFVTTENLVPSFQDLDLGETETDDEEREPEDDLFRESEGNELRESEDDNSLEPENKTTRTANNTALPTPAAGPRPVTTLAGGPLKLKGGVWACVGWLYFASLFLVLTVT